eukprot:TRINITY_DN18080_c0_g1_i6.p2 TRINITY_DN18080_c0_g1~~TRINITY_DN18080_c0_g1_i6.p2  ORF type:complete len:108 (+),score=21.58 TRINITY_DN18080_c0_g1_i6:91-414(+)
MAWKRRFLTAKEKVKIEQYANDTGLSTAAPRYNSCQCCISRWRKKIEALMAAKDRLKATIHTGMVYTEDQLLEFIDVRRAHDLRISFNMLKALACSFPKRSRVFGAR